MRKSTRALTSRREDSAAGKFLFFFKGFLGAVCWFLAVFALFLVVFVLVFSWLLVFSGRFLVLSGLLVGFRLGWLV